MKNIVIALILSLGVIQMAYADTARFIQNSSGYFLEFDNGQKVRSLVSMEDYVRKLNGTGIGGAEFETIKYMDGKGYELVNCNTSSHFATNSYTVYSSRICYFKRKDAISTTKNEF